LELKPEQKRFSSTLERKKEKPVFQSKLTSAEVTVGESVRFTVTVSGFPKPKVQWFHNGKVITSSTVYRFVEEKDDNPDGSGILIMNNIQQSDSGLYTCKAVNPFGE
uniref:Ig-like domain-containing protein n=1 Tax=Sinocyclocheilus rhinocerous TaxID=307959 RepID=A0A673JCV9_9TELE